MKGVLWHPLCPEFNPCQVSIDLMAFLFKCDFCLKNKNKKLIIATSVCEIILLLRHIKW